MSELNCLSFFFYFFAERSHSDRPQRAVGERHAHQTHEKLHPPLSRLLQVSEERAIQIVGIFILNFYLLYSATERGGLGAMLKGHTVAAW